MRLCKPTTRRHGMPLLWRAISSRVRKRLRCTREQLSARRAECSGEWGTYDTERIRRNYHAPRLTHLTAVACRLAEGHRSRATLHLCHSAAVIACVRVTRQATDCAGRQSVDPAFPANLTLRRRSP